MAPRPTPPATAPRPDGAAIELAADGEVYRYHAGGDRTPFLCATPIATAPTRL